MAKTETRGHVDLNIEIEDDPSVLGPWAIGGTLMVTHGEPRAQTLTEDQPPLGFRGELVSRNLFGALHRGQIMVDIDSVGVYRNITASYGFPRFSQEGIQFDANLRVTDVEHRYWDAMGFGSEGTAIWSYDTGSGTFKYGLGLLANRPPRFTVPGFPKSLIGPKFSYEYETRLHRFLPTEGYRIQPSLLLPPGNYDQTLFRIDAAITEKFFGDSMISMEGALQSVGSLGVSGRFSIQWDIPLDQNQDQGALSTLIGNRASIATIGISFKGRSATFGLRYHSFGFIAELALKITDSPDFTEFNQSEAIYE